MTLHESAFATVAYNEAEHWIEVTWKQHPDELEDLQTNANHIIEGMRRFGTPKLLVDSRVWGILSKEQQHWMEADWFPRAVEAGYRTRAVIVPATGLGRLGQKQVMQKTGTVVSENFDDPKQAQTWLRAQ